MNEFKHYPYAAEFEQIAEALSHAISNAATAHDQNKYTNAIGVLYRLVSSVKEEVLDYRRSIRLAYDSGYSEASDKLVETVNALLSMPEFDGTQPTSEIRRSAKRLARAAIAQATGEQP